MSRPEKADRPSKRECGVARALLYPAQATRCASSSPPIIQSYEYPTDQLPFLSSILNICPDDSLTKPSIMSRSSSTLKLSKLLRPSRNASISRARRTSPTIRAGPIFLSRNTQAPHTSGWHSAKAFSTSRPSLKGLYPESADPNPKEAEPESHNAA